MDIPRNTLIVALDQPKSLHSEGIRSVRVPQYCRTKAGAVLDLGFFHGVWSAGTCMLAVTSPA
ncbi:MAG: hypothetical protein Q7T51_01795 [Candidatus Moranbacteria bacterium]|nr:hypothetical protein [Candidatus Moranbacteria bacterium]